VPVVPLLEEAVQQVSAMSLMKQVKVITTAAPDVLSVNAARDLLNRGLVNLLSNALKFSPMESTVHVEAKHEADGVLTLSVADEGSGIPEKWHAQAFKKFGQVQARKGGAAVGSGLGLAFCRMAVEAQGGSVSLEQGRQKGTRVCLTFAADDA
jgi:two-component system sensor histidine kinase/response regulator